MKISTKELASCFGCPYHLTPQDRQSQMCVDWCYLTGKLISNITEGFPKWCPLPDKEKEVGKEVK